jgi:hypothetical protein
LPSSSRFNLFFRSVELIHKNQHCVLAQVTRKGQAPGVVSFLSMHDTFMFVELSSDTFHLFINNVFQCFF